jgi:hypothetical protein
MVDSAPDPKVEDVLSSVRRLVSQEIPRRPASRTPPSGDALVLTSDNRIETKPTHTPAPEPMRRDRSLEQRIAELEAAVDDKGTQDFEPDGSEDQAQHRPDRIVYTRTLPTDDTVSIAPGSRRLSEIALIETGPANDEFQGDVPPLEFRRDTGGADAPMAEDVPTLPPAKAEVRPFSNPDEEVERIDARIGQDENGRTVVSVPPPFVQRARPPAEDEFEQALNEAVRSSLAEDTPEDDTSPDDVWVLTPADMAPKPTEGFDTETEKTETSEALVDTPANDIETVEADELLAAVPSEPERPETLEQSAPETTQAASTPAESATDVAAGALAALSDEDAMRLLVGRLIRDELRGDLGERMTRNVRKLVRREVNRAFTERDLG